MKDKGATGPRRFQKIRGGRDITHAFHKTDGFCESLRLGRSTVHHPCSSRFLPVFETRTAILVGDDARDTLESIHCGILNTQHQLASPISSTCFDNTVGASEHISEAEMISNFQDPSYPTALRQHRRESQWNAGSSFPGRNNHRQRHCRRTRSRNGPETNSSPL
jgi:hypothetical protein